MANISQVEVNNTTYSICDAVARDSISQLSSSVSKLNGITLYQGSDIIVPASGFSLTTPGGTTGYVIVRGRIIVFNVPVRRTNADISALEQISFGTPTQL